MTSHEGQDSRDIKPGATDQDIIQSAVKFLQLCEDAESENRQLAREDVRFRAGQQWPVQIQGSRTLDRRPALTINKTDAYCTQVENQQRQQRPRIKVDPVGSQATVKVAQVYQGLIRHIENNKGGGDLAYDTAFSCAITGGEGYIRVLADYVSETSFEQELYLAPVENLFSVHFDPNSVWPDGSDGEECLIETMMPKSTFRRLYPGKDDGANFEAGSLGTEGESWVNAEEIRVAEYWRIERKARTLCILADGSVGWKDTLPPGLPPEVIVRERQSFVRLLKYWKLTATEVLEQRDLPGKWLPIIPVYGKAMIVDGKRRRKGLVRSAIDPARNYNYWRSAQTEYMALAPKAKWVMAAGQDEGFENEWHDANNSSAPVLHFNQRDADGAPATAPVRLQPEPPPAGIMAAAAAISEDLSAVLGIVDPAIRIGGNQSGKALQAERQQSDNATFNFYDNLTRSMAQVGRILVDLVPSYYAEPGRIVRIIGDDGKAKPVTLNETNPSPGPDTPGPVEAILNDVTAGEYMVVMDTGPGLTTKRQEAVAALMPLLGANDQLMNVAGDLIFRNMDFPGADIIADRLAAANPMAQIDSGSEIPPQVQMKLQQQDAIIKQLEQQLQAAGMELKTRAGIEQMKQDGATKRTLMQTTAQVHIEDQENQAWMEDTHVKAQVALSVAEINAVRELLKTSVNNRADLAVLDRTTEQEEAELNAMTKERLNANGQ
jgi:hypothetical protein